MPERQTPSYTPMRRLEPEQVRSSAPDMSALGVMAVPANLAWNMAVNPGGPMSPFRNEIQASGMQQGPVGQSMMSFQAAMREQRDMESLRKSSAQADKQKMTALATSAARMFGGKGPDGKPFDAEAFGEKLGGTAGDFLNSQAGQMLMNLHPAIEDALAPGGLAQSFSKRMYQAGMTAQTSPGKFGMSTSDVAEVERDLMKKTAPGGIVNQGVTRGFSTREMGEVAIGMSSRGALSMTQDKSKITDQILGMTGALGAMKDLMGRPDAPVNELMQALDDMFGGGVQTMPAARMEQLVSNATSLGRTMKLTGLQMQQLYKQGGNQAQAYGVDSQLGSMAMEDALIRGHAAGGGTKSVEPGVRFGVMNDQQRVEAAMDIKMRALGSENTKQVAIAMKMSELNPEFGTPSMRATLKKIKAGQGGSLTEAELTELNQASSEQNLREAAAKAGITESTYNNIADNKDVLNETIANNRIGDIDVPSLMAGAKAQVSKALLGDQNIQKLGIKTEAEANQLVTHLLDTEDKSLAGQRAQLKTSPLMAGKSDAEIEQVRIAIDTKYKKYGGMTADTAIDMGGKGARERTKALRDKTELEGEMNTAFAKAGIGQGPGGMAGLWQNAIRSMASSGASTPASKVLADTFGFVAKGDALKALSTGKPGELLKDVTEQYKKIAENTEKIVKLRREGLEISKDDADAIKKNADEVKRLEDETAGAQTKMKEGADKLKPYEGLIDPERAALSDELGMASANTMAVIGGGSTTELLKHVTGIGDTAKTHLERVATLYGGKDSQIYKDVDEKYKKVEIARRELVDIQNDTTKGVTQESRKKRMDEKALEIAELQKGITAVVESGRAAETAKIIKEGGETPATPEAAPAAPAAPGIPATAPAAAGGQSQGDVQDVQDKKNYAATQNEGWNAKPKAITPEPAPKKKADGSGGKTTEIAASVVDGNTGIERATWKIIASTTGSPAAVPMAS